MSARHWLVAAIAAAFALPANAALPPKYPLARAPLQILDDIHAADPDAAGKLPADERALVAALWEKREKADWKMVTLTDDEQMELLLRASGIDTADGRKAMRAKIEALRKSCGEKLKGEQKASVRGEIVVKHVHDAMPKGYGLSKSTLTDALDDGEFNCLSSSTVVYLVGTHHGLDLRPMIAQPTDPTKIGHAFLEWVPGPDGKRAVVECTHRNGFRAVEKMTRVERLESGMLMELYAIGRESDAAALAGSMYHNRVALAVQGKTPDFPAIARLAAAAVALDPKNEYAAAALIIATNEWAAGRIEARETGRAEKVLAVAIAASPDCPLVHENYALCAFLNNDDAAVLKRVAAAREQAKGCDWFTTAATFYERLGQRRGELGAWAGGLEAFDRGLKAVPAEERGGLFLSRGVHQLRWAVVTFLSGDVRGTVERVLATAGK